MPALTYYQLSWIMFVVRPRWSYRFNDDWTAVTHDAQSLWGHKPPAERLPPGIIRRLEPSGG